MTKVKAIISCLMTASIFLAAGLAHGADNVQVKELDFEILAMAKGLGMSTDDLLMFDPSFAEYSASKHLMAQFEQGLGSAMAFHKGAKKIVIYKRSYWLPSESKDADGAWSDQIQYRKLVEGSINILQIALPPSLRVAHLNTQYFSTSSKVNANVMLTFYDFTSDIVDDLSYVSLLIANKEVPLAEWYNHSSNEWSEIPGWKLIPRVSAAPKKPGLRRETRKKPEI